LEANDCEIQHIEVPPLPEQATDRWPENALYRVGKARQTMFEFALGYDALFMVDTDVIIGPEVLGELLKVDADVVYGVFWTQWPGFDHPLPQVWDVQPYGYVQELETVKKLANGESVEVMGGGACTLFRRRAFESRYHPPMIAPKVGMWPGEDRTFSVGCNFLGIKQVAVGGLRILHQYTPEMQTSAALKRAGEMVGL
jgi:hypothetical protein